MNDRAWQWPWIYPEPTRQQDCLALRVEDLRYAVRADAGAVPTFLDGIAREDAEGLYLDAQACPAYGSEFTLGSGRSGRYRGAYLKGIGRTRFAVNWMCARDIAHASGHLFASSAAREYLSTVYLKARGFADAVVGCTGVLAWPLSTELAAVIARESADASAPLCRADTVLQAATIKRDWFCRWSNITALLGRQRGSAKDLADLCERLVRGCTGGARGADQLDPDAIAACVASAMETVALKFEQHFRAGVHWCSLANNFAMDGRFVDLELATLVCAPAVFQLDMSVAGRARHGLAAGTELIEVARQLRAAIVRLRAHLQVVEALSEERVVARFAAALNAALTRHLPRGHWIHDVDAARARAATIVTRAGFSIDDARDIVERLERGENLTAVARAMNLPTWSAPLARSEPMLAARLIALGGREQLRDDGARDVVNTWLMRVDDVGSAEEYLSVLRQAEADITLRVKPWDTAHEPTRHGAPAHG